MRFLIDVNLPKKFSFFNSEEFIHVVDINPRMKDRDIWEYALENDLIILTKDADFYHRALFEDAGPVVVYFKLGNKTLSELHDYFTSFWPLILSKLHKARFITAYSDKIKVIN